MISSFHVIIYIYIYVYIYIYIYIYIYDIYQGLVAILNK